MVDSGCDLAVVALKQQAGVRLSIWAGSGQCAARPFQIILLHYHILKMSHFSMYLHYLVISAASVVFNILAWAMAGTDDSGREGQRVADQLPPLRDISVRSDIKMFVTRHRSKCENSNHIHR